uniref:Uncharacterized protein n=1 Tax=Anguilla anguilla TaxID=7936 RepID=A0A0E9V3A8_ANGAN
MESLMLLYQLLFGSTKHIS